MSITFGSAYYYCGPDREHEIQAIRRIVRALDKRAFRPSVQTVLVAGEPVMCELVEHESKAMDQWTIWKRMRAGIRERGEIAVEVEYTGYVDVEDLDDNTDRA